VFFPTELDENTTFLIESETEGAFTKSDLEIRPDPYRAYHNAIALGSDIAKDIAAQFGAAMEGQKVNAEVTFGIRISSAGVVMISQTLGKAQFHVRLSMTS
jgi:hypothetical protein